MKPYVIIISSTLCCLTGYFYAKHKFTNKAEEDIKNVREMYEKKLLESNNLEKKKEDEYAVNIPSPAKPSFDMQSVSKALNEYKNYSSLYGSPIIENEINESHKYVIDDDAFGASDYDDKTLYYYFINDIISDEDGNVWNNDEIEEFLGIENLINLKNRSVDYMFIRNDDTKIDYEILLSDRNFSKVIG